MSPQNPTIKLPAERVSQLKAIADALDLASVADAVGYLVRKEIERGTIPDAIPGFVIKNYRNKVSIAVDGDVPVLLSKEAVMRFADAIDGALEGEPGIVSIDYDFSVIRQGLGVRISVTVKPGGKVLSRDVARDLARILRRFAS